MELPASPEALEAEPHDLVCETEERDDCAVLDLSFKTLVDFGAGWLLLFPFEPEDEVTAQLRGILEEPLPPAAGREG